MTLEEFVGRLENVQRAARGYTACCPAHDSQSRESLSVSAGDDGRILIKCFAGCPAAEIVSALGLELKDLFPGDRPSSSRSKKRSVSKGRPRQRSTPPAGGGGGGDIPPPSGDSYTRTRPPTGLTVAGYAEAKGLPVEFLRDCGVTQIMIGGAPVVKIAYYNPAGEEFAVRFRFALEAGRGRFRWKTGSKTALYGLERLDAARAAGVLPIVEGESDVQTLALHDIASVGLPGADAWREEWAELLDGIERILVVLEPDQGGAAMRKWLGRSRLRHHAHLVSLAPQKDPSALYLADRTGFRAAWAAAVARAVPWTEEDTAARAAAAKSAHAGARALLEDPTLLARIKEAVTATGYAGDAQLPLLIYLAFTSRLLERPMNVALVGPSAAGKNAVLAAARALTPATAYYELSAGSPHALIYADEDFTHRTVVVAEADSLPEEGPAGSAIRAVAEDNVMTYDVVERDPKTGHFATRRIQKDGPTGLVTTSTRSLRTQLGTRHLELLVPDDAGQTRNVMLAHARRLALEPPALPDLTPFLELQQWLTLAGARRVVVPFAVVLAERLPAATVRMRRDFRQLLTALQASALLHQVQRPRTRDGAIIATLEDYTAVRPLLAPLFDSLATEGLTPVVRLAVEAVQVDEEKVSLSDLATRLAVSKTTAAYRARRATDGGWLINDERRRGQPAQFRRGLPLPDDVEALPSVDLVRRLYECTNGSGEGVYPPPPPPTGPGEGGSRDATEGASRPPRRSVIL
jgi:hypothetical protein